MFHRNKNSNPILQADKPVKERPFFKKVIQRQRDDIRDKEEKADWQTEGRKN